MKNKIIASVCCLFFSVAAYAKLDITNPEYTKPSNAFLYEGKFSKQKINMKTVTIRQKGVDFKYPQFTGFKNKDQQNSINNKIKNLVLTWINNAKVNRLKLQGNYEIYLSSEKAISIKFSYETDNATKPYLAHPDSKIFTLNFDFKNKKELRLADLFKPNSDYLKAISTIAIADLNKRAGTEDATLSAEQKQIKKANEQLLAKDQPDMSSPEKWIKTGAAPDLKNYQYFLLSRDNLIIIFDYYQVGPRVMGTPSILIPYQKLQDIIDPNGVLSFASKQI